MWVLSQINRFLANPDLVEFEDFLAVVADNLKNLKLLPIVHQESLPNFAQLEF
jgi:hypothetical protein